VSESEKGLSQHLIFRGNWIMSWEKRVKHPQYLRRRAWGKMLFLVITSNVSSGDFCGSNAAYSTGFQVMDAYTYCTYDSIGNSSDFKALSSMHPDIHSSSSVVFLEPWTHGIPKLFCWLYFRRVELSCFSLSLPRCPHFRVVVCPTISILQ
jgi:hypothetical protein